MPDRQPLTEEEYNRVRYNATKTRPAGLSDDEFENWVLQAAHREEVAKAASDIEHGGTVPPAPEWSLSPASAVSGFLGGLANVPGAIYGAVRHPINTVQNLVTSQFVDQPLKAIESAKAGDYISAASHTAAAAYPFFGPVLADIYERAGQTGDIGRALGETAALYATAKAAQPEVGGAALRNIGGATERMGTMLRRPANYMAGYKLLGSAGGAGLGGLLPAAAVMAAPTVTRLLGAGTRLLGTGYETLVPRAAESVRRMLGPMGDTAFGSAIDDAEGITAPPSTLGRVQRVLRAPASEALNRLIGDPIRDMFGMSEPEAPPDVSAPRGRPLSRPVPGFTYPGEELAYRGPSGGWTGNVGRGVTQPPFTEGEIIEPDIEGRTIAGTAPQRAGLPPGPGAPLAALPPAGSIQVPPSSVDTAMDTISQAAGRRALEADRAVPDPYVSSPERFTSELAARGVQPEAAQDAITRGAAAAQSGFESDLAAIRAAAVNKIRAWIDEAGNLHAAPAESPPPPPPPPAAAPVPLPPTPPPPAPPAATVPSGLEGRGFAPAGPPSLEALAQDFTPAERLLMNRLITQQGVSAADAARDVLDARAYRGPRPSANAGFGPPPPPAPPAAGVPAPLPPTPPPPVPPAAAPPTVPIDVDQLLGAQGQPPATPPAGPPPVPPSIASLNPPTGGPPPPRLPPRVTSANPPAVLADAARAAIAKIRDLGHDAITYDEQSGQWWTERSGAPHSRTRTVRRAGRDLAPLLDVLNHLPVDLVKQVLKEK